MKSPISFQLILFAGAVFVLLHCKGSGLRTMREEAAILKKEENICIKIPTPVTTPMAQPTPGGPPTFEKDIKPVLHKTCASCHGSKAKSISNYNEIGAIKAKMVQVALNEIQDSNHNSSTVTVSSSESRAFQDWERNGYPQGDPSTAPPSTEECYDPFKDMLNPTEKQTCDQQNVMFDRATKSCLTAVLDISWCTSVTTIRAEFEKSYPNANKQTIANEIDTKLKAGFEVDQCGKDNEKAVVSFVKRIREELRIESVILRFN